MLFTPQLLGYETLLIKRRAAELTMLMHGALAGLSYEMNAYILQSKAKERAWTLPCRTMSLWSPASSIL